MEYFIHLKGETFFTFVIRMSLLPNKTYSSPNNPLYATVAQLQALSTTLSTINISTATGSGLSVSEPLANNFVFTNALSNAGGISFVSVPGSTTLGLSNAGVTGLVAGTGVSVSGATGNVTVANTGVTGLVAGSGIGVSGGTGSVTVSNTGVNSVTAGSGITISGTSTAPVIANSISANVNVVQDQFGSNPITATTPAGGSITNITTYTGLIPGKTYLFCLNLALSSSTTDDSKTCNIGLRFGSPPELYQCMTIPNNTSGLLQNATCAVTIPAGQTSVQLTVSGTGYTTETANGTVNNAVIILMN